MRLKSDKRILEAKRLILEAVAEHSQKLTEVKPPQKEKIISYQELLDALNKARGNPLFYPYIGSGLGNGALVELLDGSVKYDMISGIGVHAMGHSHPDLISGSIDAAISDTVMQGNLQQNQESLELSELLINGSGLHHCFLSTSGITANENALKIAFQKNAPADRILAFDHCFAGRSTTLTQITDKPSFREGLRSRLPIDYIPFFDYMRPEESTREAVDQLKKHIVRYPKEHAIMIFELIQGEGGFWPGTKEFFHELMSLCKEHSIAVLADEVQTFGRTDRLFAFQHFGLEHFIDIATVGKMSQVCATLFSGHYQPRPGLLSQTFIGSTSSLLAGMTIIKKLLHENFLQRNGEIQQRFAGRFAQMEGLVSGPYGIGSMVAFTPLSGTYDIAMKVLDALYKEGVITFIAGSHPFRIRMLPPAMAITDRDIDEVATIIHKVLKHVSP
jgi:4-aminobutyrate aminotransferase-like enzyme